MFFKAALALALLSLLHVPATAQDAPTARSFGVSVIGIPVGEVNLTHKISEKGKHVYQSGFATTGLLAIVKDVKFVMLSRAAVVSGVMDPEYYTERMNTGKRKSSNKVNFQPGDARWDPNTAMASVLSDRPVTEGCGFQKDVFDGERSHRLTINSGTKQGDKLECTGTFMRTGGYTEEQLSDRPGYDFMVRYVQRGDRYVFDMAEGHTDFGRVRIQSN